MKKQILLLILMLLPLAASADYSGSCGTNVTYTFEEATGTLTISGTGAMYNNSSVPWASYKDKILKAIVTDGVTSIGNDAFWDCSSLTSVTIGNSVTSIGTNAFSGCSGLTSIDIPNSVTSIGNDAFYGCSGLTSIDIPNSVTSIGYEAFQYCSGLTSVTIGNSVTSIGEYAFSGCSSLTSVTIGNSVTSIGTNAFSGCSGLTSVHISDLAAWCKISFGDNPLSYAHHLYLNGEEIIDLVIPNSVTSIGNGAFRGCSSLTSVTIPNSVTSIGNSAFSSCSSLTSVTIPNSVTSIGDWAFYYCSGLTSITIPNSVKSIGWYAFYACSELKMISIGSNINTIGKLSFANCPKMENVYCYAVRYPTTSNDAFQGSYPDYATLYVPEESIEPYSKVEPWSLFRTIKKIENEENPDSPEGIKCAIPTISYGSKKLMFDCETEGVEFVTEIKDADIGKFYDDRITLSATYEISVYATKAGYNNSDKATATLVWANATFTDTTPATAIEMVPAMEAAMPVLIQNNGGMLTVQGAQDGTPVSVYTIAGTEAGSAVSQNSRATISTSMQQGDIAIVRIGNRSVKVVLK